MPATLALLANALYYVRGVTAIPEGVAVTFAWGEIILLCLLGTAGVLGYVALILRRDRRNERSRRGRTAPWGGCDGVCDVIGVEPVLAGLTGDRWIGACCWLFYRPVASASRRTAMIAQRAGGEPGR